MSLPFYRYVNIDNNLYVVAADSYLMKWSRAFSSQLAGNIIRLNFIDRGVGIRVYDMTLILKTWKVGSQPYNDGITLPWDTQLQNLEASWKLQAAILHFVDPFGRSPNPATGGPGDYGVLFTNYNLIIPKYATPQTPVALAEIELTEATQLVNTP